MAKHHGAIGNDRDQTQISSNFGFTSGGGGGTSSSNVFLFDPSVNREGLDDLTYSEDLAFSFAESLNFEICHHIFKSFIQKSSTEDAC